jgi:hypothetical protein
MVGCLIFEIGQPKIIVFVTMVVFLITGVITTDDAVNTPSVVTFAPILKKCCESKHVSPSRFLIALSYATILGGPLP